MSPSDRREAVEWLAGFADEYEREHFGERVRDIGATVDTIDEVDAETFLKFFYHHYAFNRAGGAKAGYPEFAVTAVDDVGVDPEGIWAEFKASCQQRDVGLNKRMNYGAVTESAELVADYGNLFAWIGDEVLDTGRAGPVYETIGEIRGVGEKITRFFVRDAVWVTGVESAVPSEDAEYLHPMDVWTRRVAYILWPDLWGAPDAEISRRVATGCEDAGVSHAEFNQGAWYFGAKRMDGDVQAFVRELQTVAERAADA